MPTNSSLFKIFFLCSLFVFQIAIAIETTEVLAAPLKEPKLCDSARDFTTAFEFLKKESDLGLSDTQSLKLALQIAEGCSGSAQRFIDIYQLLKVSGVTLSMALDSSLPFSKMDDDRTKNFASVFKQSSTGSLFELDFSTSFKLSFVLSKFSGERIKSLREDFVEILKYCTDAKKIGLPLRTCADYGIRAVELSNVYKEPLFPQFVKVYSFLTQGGDKKGSVNEALESTYKILSYGPKATENFFKIFDYANGRKMELSQAQSLELALRVAKLSIQGETSSAESLHPSTPQKEY